jgi:pyridoxal biosynthesis lyase PdxS
MQLGAEAVFVGSGIFSEDLTGAMKGLAVAALNEAQMLQTRGW